MKITVNQFNLENIFCSDFQPLLINNEIDFSSKKISILYGPNGTGKTSFANVLNKCTGAKYEIIIDGITYTEEQDKVFHVITDQNGRNIIQGSTEDFILGENIKKEYELKKQLEDGFQQLFNTLTTTLKNDFLIATKESVICGLMSDQNLKDFISDLANNKSKGKSIKRNNFLDKITNLKNINIPLHDETKLNYLISDYASKDSVLTKLKQIKLGEIKQETQITKIDESNEAVRILEKFHYSNDCIVCDNSILRESLLDAKKTLYQTTLNSLSEQARSMLEDIVNKSPLNDPFNLKDKITNSLISGDAALLSDILKELNEYEKIIEAQLINLFIELVANSNLASTQSSYDTLILEKPEFEEEDVLFIENFLNECIGKKISLSRDSNNNLKLLLGTKEFLNQERTKLSLSNGEQNFLSLAFELLKAKKTEHHIIVLDDPISSFDSIYKNKIAYAIIKILSDKNSIVLTHNTDLIKLLEHQHKNCFNLYFINNTTGEENGFIPINPSEVKILLYMHELLNLLRGGIASEVINEKAFLAALIPYMRGYCQVIGDIKSKNELTSIMHGYKNEKVNVTDIYNKLFINTVIKTNHEISAQDIIALDISSLSILKPDTYPLLNKTLKHTLSYLYLRLKVEKKLVDKFSINTDKKQLLSEIILEAFKTKSKEDIQNKVFFLSRKTLLNEFNHFEIDMNIFQPAIDITDSALKKEKSDIEYKLSSL